MLQGSQAVRQRVLRVAGQEGDHHPGGDRPGTGTGAQQQEQGAERPRGAHGGGGGRGRGGLRPAALSAPPAPAPGPAPPPLRAPGAGLGWVSLNKADIGKQPRTAHGREVRGRGRGGGTPGTPSPRMLLGIPLGTLPARGRVPRGARYGLGGGGAGGKQMGGQVAGQGIYGRGADRGQGGLCLGGL